MAEPVNVDEADSFRILLVEDETLIAMELTALLRRLGHTVLGPAVSVPQALGLIDTTEPELALLDVNLKGERVTPVAERLRARGTPFLLVTGYSRRELEEGVLQTAPILAKPLSLPRLRQALQRLAGR